MLQIFFGMILKFSLGQTKRFVGQNTYIFRSKIKLNFKKGGNVDVKSGNVGVKIHFFWRV